MSTSRQIDRQDDGIAELYQKVCENIRHNLSLIRSYSKETLVPDAKAVYLSIVDAAVTGPHPLEKLEAVAVLGVSYKDPLEIALNAGILF